MRTQHDEDDGIVCCLCCCVLWCLIAAVQCLVVSDCYWLQSAKCKSLKESTISGENKGEGKKKRRVAAIDEQQHKETKRIGRRTEPSSKALSAK